MVEPIVRVIRLLLLLPVLGLFGGCSTIVMNPAGDIAVQERNLIIASTALMLLIIIPVIAFTIIFAWRYRASNTTAAYDPDWHHSTQLEVLIWTAPLLIIIALGALTWISTHVLDPYRSVDRLDPTHLVESGAKPLTIEVVALDWKWLFFYPDQGFATVNELAAPVDTPIDFRITSAAVMNSFFVPALAGQIYAMPGMQTRLHAVLNKPGEYQGMSANYSGAGFSHMNFKFHGYDQQGFDNWVGKAKADPARLDAASYADLARPSEQEPVRYYGSVQDGLFNAILNLCATPGKMCENEMMAIDAKGGAGVDSQDNRDRLTYDGARLKEGNEAPGATFPASGRPPNTNVAPQGMKPTSLTPDVNMQKTEPDQGQGNAMPGMSDDMPGMTKSEPAPAQLNTK